MIDIEDSVFNRVQTAVTSQFPNAFVVGRESRSPSKFPCVSIVEIDNYALARTQDSDSMENHAAITYEINVYSNKQKGCKAECKSIRAIADATMAEIGFTRTMKQPISLDDATKFRMVARYAAVAGTDNKIYRR